jgi:hypothetical protein
MSRHLSFLALLSLLSSAHGGTPIPEGMSCIPYGSNWAFMMSAPRGWVGECHAEKSTGATVAYWPASGQWATSTSVMYVSVYSKNGESLAQVIEHDSASFKERNPEGVIADGDPIKASDGELLTVKLTAGLKGGRFEAIAYADQPTAVLIIGLTSKTETDRDSAMGAFRELIGRYVRIDKVQFENSKPGPT